MDVEGYVPCAMLFDFPRVKQLCYSIDYLMAACANSKIIQVDSQNEKVRLRLGWEKWLYPGQNGEMGVPLYKKFPRASSPLPQFTAGAVPALQQTGSSSVETDTSSSSDNESEPSMSAPPTPSRAMDTERASLSADAAEWKPSF